MKSYAKVQKYLVMLLLTMCTTVVTAQFTRQQAIDKVLNEIVVADTGNINVYSVYTLRNYQDSINLAFATTLLCPYNYNWVFFVDDHPIAGWTHPCRYIFMDSVTGIYQITNEDQYPACFDNIDCIEYEVISQIYSYPVATLPPNQNPPDNTTITNDNLYAVLIVTQDVVQGGSVEIPNRFWYDISVVYNTLIQEYGYSDENIFVHYYDGTSHSYYNHPTDLNNPDNNEDHIDYTASKSRILETFNNLSGESTSDINIPKLDSTDQLFVFVDGHGTNRFGKSTIICKYPDIEYLYDDEVAEAVEKIDCAQMIFLFETCNSGNFAVELTDYNSYDSVKCENRIVHTATTLERYSWNENYLTGSMYTEFTFYWTAAVRGVYPVYEFPWMPSFATGSFPFDSLYPFDHPDDYDPDLNSDGFVQMDEAFWYADDWDARSEGHPDNPEPYGYFYDDPNCWPDACIEVPVKENTICENLTTLYGLAGTIDDSNELFGNRNYLVGNTLTVDSEFKINDNANITISGEDARIIVNSSGIFKIYDDITFSGSEIIVDGDIEIGERATFNNIELNLNNHSLQTTFNNSVFNNSLLHNYGEELTINSSNFNNCNMVYSHRGDVTVTNSTTFNNTGLYIEDIYGQEDYMATVTGCTFSTDMTMIAIDLLNYDRFNIKNNLIDGHYGGIHINNSGEGASGNQVIYKNEIRNCTGSAIVSYNSTLSISSNNIHNNMYGVKFFNNCNTALFGNSNATTYSESQQIKDNYSYEVYASPNSFPWYMRHNVIIDEDNAGNPNDALVHYDNFSTIGETESIDIRYNCWGDNFVQSEDLYPIDGYTVDPEWCPGGDTIIHLAAEILYVSGREQYETAEYVNAKNTFEMVISQYPKTEYASASMKDLFTVEQFITNDYSTLKQYYDDDLVIQEDSILKNLSDFLSNKCDIKLENWQPSINHYEDIINYPETPEDSIFAIIDLGYLYLLMDNSGGRAQATGHLLEHKPNTKEEFSEKRDFLLALLPFKKEAGNNNFEFNQLEGNILLQNTPNPTNSVTTIYFQLKEQCEGSIKIINGIGKVTNEIHFSKTAGLHNIELDMSNIPVGIYYYSMVINGKRTDTKKMVVVK